MNIKLQRKMLNSTVLLGRIIKSSLFCNGKRFYAVKSSSNYDPRHDIPTNPKVNDSSSFFSHPCRFSSTFFQTILNSKYRKL